MRYYLCDRPFGIRFANFGESVMVWSDHENVPVNRQTAVQTRGRRWQRFAIYLIYRVLYEYEISTDQKNRI